MASRRIRQFVAPLLLACGFAGCGGNAPSSAKVDLVEILDQYEAKQRRHDPTNMVEVQVGEFSITRQIDDQGSVLYLNIDLYAVVWKEAEGQFVQRLETHQNRLRNRVITTLQEVDFEHLKDPDGGWLKSELVRSLSDELESRAVRDVVFTTFSLTRG